MATKTERIVYYYRGTNFKQVNSNGTSSTQTSTPSPFVLTSSVTTGWIRAWKDKVRACVNATTALSGTREKCMLGPIRFTGRTTGFSVNSTWVGTTDDIGLPGLLDVDNALLLKAQADAGVRFRKKYREATRAINGLNIVAEMRETLQLIRNPARGIRNILERYAQDRVGGLRRVKSNRKSLKQFRDDTADAWLEVQFGVKPLASDIQDAVDVLNKRDHFYSNPHKRISGSGSHKATQTSSHMSAIPGTSFTLRWLQHKYVAYLYKYYGAFGLNDVGANPDAALFGFDTTDFIPTFYEIIPFSFVADYFTNLQDLVEAYALRDLKMRWLSGGSKVQQKSFNIAVGILPQSNYSGSASGRLVRERTTVVRVPEATLTAPTLQWTLPGYTSQWANLAALGQTLGTYDSLARAVARR